MNGTCITLNGSPTDTTTFLRPKLAGTFYLQQPGFEPCPSTVTCGEREEYPFSSISEALRETAKYANEKRVFMFGKGEYTGADNFDHHINGGDVEFINPTFDVRTVIIECSSVYPPVFTVTNASFVLRDITIKYCGGAFAPVVFENSVGTLTNVQFDYTTGSLATSVYVGQKSSVQVIGGRYNAGIYPTRPFIRTSGHSELDILQLNSSMLDMSVTNYLQLEQPMVICQDSRVTVDSSSFARYSCQSGCSVIATSTGTNICPIYYSVPEPIFKYEGVGSTYQCIDTKCGDQKCDPYEVFFCSTDCPNTIFEGLTPGFYTETFFSTNCRASIEIIGEPVISDFLNAYPEGYATLFAYFRVPSSKVYQFTAESNDIEAVIEIDNAQVYHSSEESSNGSPATFERFIEGPVVHSIKITLFTKPFSNLRSFSLKSDKSINYFYSKNKCGDGIKDNGEVCVYDEKGWTSQASCGDGICNEVNFESCFVDCHAQFTTTCSATNVPDNHLSPGYTINDDTLGDMISNQQIWHLPGSEHLSSGFDIVKGEEGALPIFYFDYCTKEEKNLLQDVYRQSIYELPEELTGGVHPKCTFDTSQQTHSSISQFRTEKSQSTSFNIDGSAGGGWGGYSAQVAASYSKDRSVNQAMSLSTSAESTVISTSLICTTSSVEMVKYTFHPSFLKELASVKFSRDMYEVVKRYGTHFYQTAVLGGSLKQLTVIDKQTYQSESSTSWQESSQRSFSASASAPVMQASGRYADTSDYTVSGERQESMESKSSRSSVEVLGGEPGSYSPDSPNQGNMLQSWAKSLDFLPVPVEYKLSPIRDILPDDWKNADGNSIKDLWMQGETQYYEENAFFGAVGVSGAIFITITPEMPTEQFTTPQVDPAAYVNVHWKNAKGELVTTRVDLEGIMTTTTKDAIPMMIDFSQSEQAPDIYQWSKKAFTNKTAVWNSPIPKQHYHPSIYTSRMPWRVNFNLASKDNFFESTQKPTITHKLPTLPTTKRFEFHFVDFKGSRGFKVDNTQNVVTSQYIDFYLTSFGHYWSDYPSYLVRPGITRCKSDSDSIAQVMECLYKTTKKYDTFTMYRGAVNAANPHISVQYDYNAVKTRTIDWWSKEFKAYTGANKNTLAFTAQDYYGSQFRLAWVMVFESSSSWLRPIVGYTAPRSMSSFITPRLFANATNANTAIPLPSVKLQPLRQLNDFDFFTTNYGILAVIFVVDAADRERGKESINECDQ
ncbi:hypothetical protein DFA_05882 [Cavenderia fasciculata]|uniref:MACPF domain-containing protein n=1 Tax=Cavenderia fasciculata TaxID=261658 RepID=F4PN58_CACFS|nr:uncharacterized protein DFA_05882 [Cavenderia fasciculata]EGG23748.1 hypothetical protein DFA_05882 [Cavenderia fasciculata]|eukprot:XP_004361599.1 hypothetical protein DFA_05882 [Cavenderia fasciculata]